MILFSKTCTIKVKITQDTTDKYRQIKIGLKRILTYGVRYFVLYENKYIFMSIVDQ